MNKEIAALLTVLLTILRGNSCMASSYRRLESFLLRNYDPRELPSTTSTEVKIGVYFNKIGDPDESNSMQFSGNFYLQQNWKDQRLQYHQHRGIGRELILSDDAVNKVWKPDIVFKNGYDISTLHTIHDHQMMKLNSSGFLWFVTQLTGTFYCPMDLQNYPFDTQTCTILLESFRHTMDEYFLTWMDHKSQVDTTVPLNKYTLENVTHYDCSQQYATGACTCLEIKFKMRRRIGYFIIQIFLPTMLLVILSWSVLWMDIQHFPHRLGLISLFTLCIILMHATVGNQVAQVQYVKALDIWMGICLMFNLAILIESIVVKVIYNWNRKTSKHVSQNDPTASHSHDNRVSGVIDLASRAAFPVVYLLAVIIYFVVYLH